MQAKTMLFSVYGFPLLGVAGLLVCLWHPHVAFGAAARGQDMMYLVQPSSRMDRSMSVFLKQEARNVAYSRTHDGPARQAHTRANYNLIAQECTPAVFQKTHLPTAMTF